MLEDIEGLSSSGKSEMAEGLSEVQRDYISEVIPLNNPELLVDRIDELDDKYPPKAIDKNADVAELIKPIKEQIDNRCLEAPSDNIQIEKASDAMYNIEGLKFEEWKELSIDKRIESLQKVEESIAEIAHRDVCPIDVKNLGAGTFGYFDPNTKMITINSDYIASDSFTDYKECLDTIVHEGRHAYQYYNLTEREIHPREGDLTNWKSNEFEYGYQDAKTCGFAAYWLQPQESDARAFAEDVLKSYLKK